MAGQRHMHGALLSLHSGAPPQVAMTCGHWLAVAVLPFANLPKLALVLFFSSFPLCPAPFFSTDAIIYWNVMN